LGVASGGSGTTTPGLAGTVAYWDGSILRSTGQGSANQVLISNGSGAPSFVSTTTIVGGQAFVQGGNSFNALAILGTSDANALAIKTNGSELMRLTTTQTVGINSTTPSAILAVQGTSTQAALDIFRVASSSNATFLTVTQAGNVGIGSTSPAALLSLQGTSG
jgi:hypothetical protein